MIANWPSLTAVAEALLERGTLDGQEFDNLVRATARRGSRPPG